MAIDAAAFNKFLDKLQANFYGKHTDADMKVVELNTAIRTGLLNIEVSVFHAPGEVANSAKALNSIMSALIKGETGVFKFSAVADMLSFEASFSEVMLGPDGSPVAETQFVLNCLIAPDPGSTFPTPE